MFYVENYLFCEGDYMARVVVIDTGSENFVMARERIIK